MANGLLIILSAAALLGYLSASLALALGILFGLVFANQTHWPVSRWAGPLLKVAIVILGFTLPMTELINTAQQTFSVTLSMIITALLLGFGLAKLFKLNQQQAWLISSGTAICGGSAIAAVGSSIKASPTNMVISLAIVFVLNAVALFAFPLIGDWLSLSQQQFGIWAALGIHDTSSVVGAAAQYGEQALEVATTSKLARALWIIPVALLASMSQSNSDFKITIPLFIVFFVLASFIGGWIELGDWTSSIKSFAKHLFALSLLLMGTSLNKNTFKSLPINALLVGIILWVALSVCSLLIVLYFY